MAVIRLIEVARALRAEFLVWPRGPGQEVLAAHASDQMSEVLTSASPGAILITGLTNGQVMKTAEVAGISAVVFVGGKPVLPSTIHAARHAGIPVLVTTLSMFESCGRLYQAGLRSCSQGNEGLTSVFRG